MTNGHGLPPEWDVRAEGVDSSRLWQLATEDVVCQFGELRALTGVTVTAARGEITALIGPNGAGKTTLLNVISGLTPLQAGRVRLGERDITRWPTERRAMAGIARTFQTPRLLEMEDVATNVAVGCNPLRQPIWYQELLNTPRARAARRRDQLAVAETMRILGIASIATRAVRDLPFAMRRLVELGRALAGSPSVLMLDEPAAGLESDQRATLALLLRRVVEASGITILVIEHDVQFVTAVADSVFALDFGMVIAHGSAGDVLAHPAVRAAFFGIQADAGFGD